jgi:hypothetical protein
MGVVRNNLPISVFKSLINVRFVGRNPTAAGIGASLGDMKYPRLLDWLWIIITQQGNTVVSYVAVVTCSLDTEMMILKY